MEQTIRSIRSLLFLKGVIPMKKFLILLFIAFLTGCTSQSEVSLSETTIEPIIGAEGEVVQLPQPVRDGFNFLGWYIDSSLNQSVSNNYTIPSSDVIL